ncbi:MAG: hypothetical protein BGO51_22035 [Rhodospirillales bacterium 69-11]|nr:hypothetical protein [Rhodospirillales bacterium]MBN8929955.1 hypothetical protein [Rhodospirillales bacterium]OJW20524.1 MAG: hypothetical protein BGO51_22035 [Rhodospirillales bacterium 69-11]
MPIAKDEKGDVRKNEWGRPIVLDDWGNPLPTPHQIEMDAILQKRIQREMEAIKQGFASQPTAGHGEKRDDGEPQHAPVEIIIKRY